jgi:CheY-like chemotaxis protein
MEALSTLLYQNEPRRIRSRKPILVVEDDRVDAMTIMRAFAEIKAPNSVVLLKDGEEAMGYLNDPEKEKPCLMLLDLNLPRMNGLELLHIMKDSSRLKRIPVVILTTSRDRHDRRESFDLGAAGYMIKPIEDDGFINLIDTIGRYWTLSELSDEA